MLLICKINGVDINKKFILVVFGIYFYMGGVKMNCDGEMFILNLYVVGEVVCNGVYGVNRLVSNLLLEGFVFGKRIGWYILFREIKEKVNMLVEKEVKFIVLNYLLTKEEI